MADIDWRDVLGPLLNGHLLEGHLTDAHLTDAQSVITPSELPILTEAMGRHSDRAVRLHPSIDSSQLPFDAEVIPWFDRGRWLLDAKCRPGAFLNYAAGDYYIQDAGSMLALALCDVRPGQSICDTCAAPGGKSSGLLELLGGTGLVVSNEVIRSRLELLETTLARTGHANYLVSNCEVEQLADRCAEAFDCVLVDAPCTGQSMLARGKQSLSAFTSRQMEHSAARQQRILRAAAELVKPGGRLVYSTCTFAFVENEAIIDWFLQTHSGWQAHSDDRLTRWSVPGHAGCYRLWPHRDRCAGAFAAVLIRGVDEELAAYSEELRVDRRESASNLRRSQREWNEFDIALAELPWLRSRDSNAATHQLRLWRRGDELYYFDAQIPAAWIEASHAGVPIAEWRGGQWQPSYAASLVHLPSVEPTQRIELSDRQAAEYLSGNAVRIEPAESGSAATTPWIVVAWRGRSLGWAKFAAGTLKNHLPKLLRKTGLAANNADVGSFNR